MAIVLLALLGWLHVSAVLEGPQVGVLHPHRETHPGHAEVSIVRDGRTDVILREGFKNVSSVKWTFPLTVG